MYICAYSMHKTAYSLKTLLISVTLKPNHSPSCVGVVAITAATASAYRCHLGFRVHGQDKYAAEDEGGKGRAYSRMKLVVGNRGSYGHHRVRVLRGFGFYQSSNLMHTRYKAIETQKQLVMIKCPIVTSALDGT